MASGGCLHNRYLNVIKGYLKGDLGPDYKYPNRSVQELILGAFPVSLELAEGNQLTRCWLLVAGCPAVQDFREKGRLFPIVIQPGATPHLLRFRPRNLQLLADFQPVDVRARVGFSKVADGDTQVLGDFGSRVAL